MQLINRDLPLILYKLYVGTISWIFSRKWTYRDENKIVFTIGNCGLRIRWCRSENSKVAQDGAREHFSSFLTVFGYFYTPSNPLQPWNHFFWLALCIRNRIKHSSYLAIPGKIIFNFFSVVIFDIFCIFSHFS